MVLRSLLRPWQWVTICMRHDFVKNDVFDQICSCGCCALSVGGNQKPRVMIPPGNTRRCCSTAFSLEATSTSMTRPRTRGLPHAEGGGVALNSVHASRQSTLEGSARHTFVDAARPSMTTWFFTDGVCEFRIKNECQPPASLSGCWLSGGSPISGQST